MKTTMATLALISVWLTLAFNANAGDFSASGCDLNGFGNNGAGKVSLKCSNSSIDTSGLTNSANKYTDNKVAEATTNIQNNINNTSKLDREYTDQKANEAQSNAMNSANSYTNQKAQEQQRYTDQKAHEAQSNATNSANSYTNQKAQEQQRYTEQKSQDAEINANHYTDTKISENNTVINQNINNAKDDAIKAGQDAANRAEGNANNYTDSKITDTRNELNTNIANSKNEAITTSNKYTDDRYREGVSYTDKKYDQSTHYAQNVANQAERNANHYTDEKFSQLSQSSNQRFRELGNRIDQAEKRINAGIAGVTAIASIPYVAENTFSYGIGLGNYQNSNAAAAGVQYKTSPNTNVRLNISWDSSHNSALGVGFAGGW